MKKFGFIILLIILTSSQFFSQEIDSTKLTIDRIFASREFSQQRLSRIQWFDDGNSYTMLDYSKDGQNILVYNTETNESKILVSSRDLIPNNFDSPITIENYEFSDDQNLMLIFTNSTRVWRTNTKGDYWIYNFDTKTLSQLGKQFEPSTLMFATLSPDNKSTAYVYKNNLYVESLQNSETTQLTFDGSETIINGTFDWVYEEELGLRNGFRWSPDGKRIAFWQLDTEGVGIFNMINNTDSIYSSTIPVQYPKVGTQNSACKVGNVDLSTKQITWFKIPGDPRNNYLARMDWAESNTEVIIQQLNRPQNENRVYIGNAETGGVNNIFTDKDEAWVEVVDDIKWFNDGKFFTWLSEKDGWNHVYLISRDGKEIINITPGNFDVMGIVGIDQTSNLIYFYASPENATQRYLYRKSIFAKMDKIKITPQNYNGFNSYNISPNFKWAIHTFSNINTPTEANIINLPEHKAIRNLQSNDELLEKIAELKLNPVELFKVDIGNNIILDGWKILPTNFDESQKYPVLFYVYGEPGSQTVVDSWSRTFFWHQLLTQNGYIIISIDNRGTPAPRGREWRKCVYGQIGILASEDQANAVKKICEWNFIDKDRIGIWGWSGGGSMSLNAIFRYPDLYKTAVAVAPVTDLKLYDTIYEERYMGLLSENPEGYKNGSPVTFANQLKGNLLVMHGTGDDNVHYQNTEVLINELVKYNKIFSVMPYPNRSHGIFEGQNTYRHVYEMMFNYLRNNL